MAQIIGKRWKIVRSLDEGGQGQTFLVQDIHKPDSPVRVLKRLKNLDRIKRFAKEISALDSVSHPNIVALIDSDLGDKKPFIVMEYCSGGSLAQAQPIWREPPMVALALFEEICHGVRHVHELESPIIHRDLKPDNIFFREVGGTPVVGDFGLCFIDEPTTRETDTAEAVGAARFMAPELEDGRLDEASTVCDVYSLGKILYWLFAGRIFSREKHREPEWDLREIDPDDPIGCRDAILEHVNLILDRMIVFSPEDRAQLSETLPMIKQAKFRLEGRFNAISAGNPQICIYCGEGRYVLQHTNDDIALMGLRTYSGTEWKAFVCHECGNVQYFRIDLARRRSDWDGVE